VSSVDDIEAAVVMAEASTGVRGGKSKLRACIKTTKSRRRVWSEDDDQFLRVNVGILSESEIARRLGRTVCGVHIRRERDLHLDAPSKKDTILSAEHISRGLGMDGKTIHLLIDRGIMPGRRLPTERTIRVVDRVLFLKWLCNPKNWLYLHPERVGAMRPMGRRRILDGYDFVFWENARRLVLAKRKQWKDEWMTPGQVIGMLGFASSYYLNVAIHKGTLKATRWGNWRILRSDIPKGKTLNFKGEWIKRRSND